MGVLASVLIGAMLQLRRMRIKPFSSKRNQEFQWLSLANGFKSSLLVVARSLFMFRHLHISFLFSLQFCVLQFSGGANPVFMAQSSIWCPHFRCQVEKLQNNGEVSSLPMLLTSQQQTQDVCSLHS